MTYSSSSSQKKSSKNWLSVISSLLNFLSSTTGFLISGCFSSYSSSAILASILLTKSSTFIPPFGCILGIGGKPPNNSLIILSLFLNVNPY